MASSGISPGRRLPRHPAPARSPLALLCESRRPNPTAGALLVSVPAALALLLYHSKRGGRGRAWGRFCSRLFGFQFEARCYCPGRESLKAAPASRLSFPAAPEIFISVQGIPRSLGIILCCRGCVPTIREVSLRGFILRNPAVGLVRLCEPEQAYLLAIAANICNSGVG